ncbi:MBL fold metallo-hydrolase [Microbispora sp. H11081]|uniref:MBL fold metallo-hydrolase n=1 Tax=Microbispora sp. H11081 TaxID=2729107 RepID=UPI001472A7C7|nr:MBL fold metallo-hydrolase [Microbispora sp. H11081]
MSASKQPNPVRSMPPVELLAPGLWVIPLPLPIPDLRYVYIYAFESGQGPYLVDAGWDNDECHAALEAGLAAIGSSVSEVRGIMVTHSHPDHFGLAARIREASGCWIGMHPAEAAMVTAMRREPREDVSTALRVAGAPDGDSRLGLPPRYPATPASSYATADRLVEDGDLIPVPGWDIRAVWTPGHTPGHLCYRLPALDALLTGDHILPRITPHIGVQGFEGDSVTRFIESLNKVADLNPSVAYPAHEYRFVGVRERALDLVAHHNGRFAEVLAALDGRSASLWQIAESMPWSMPWQEMGAVRVRIALDETLAHLKSLALHGLVEEVPGARGVWRRLPPATS